MAISFKIGFQADTKDLETSLQRVSTDIAKAFTFKGNLTKELSAATQQAMVLEKALKRATAEDGTISYSQLQFQLNAANTSAAKLTATLASGGANFQNSLTAANQALALSNRSALTLGKTMKEIWRVTTQSFKFTAAQTFLRAVSGEAQKAVGWVKNLNEAVNNIGVVTGKTDGELQKITNSAIQASQQLKVAAKDYAEGALIYYQQGLSDEEVSRRTEITIKAAKAANQSVDEMSKQLTSIWNNFKMIGDEQQRAAAVGAALAANTAVDFKDIAEAMESAAAPAAQMGVEYNQLAAIIATVGDVSQQSASTIGNAYKTIFSRFQQLTTEGTDGEVTLNSVSKKLEDLGIKVLDQAGNLRKLGDVINEVGTNWDKWTQTQQTAIAQIVGGTRQYGQFLTLMNNFDKYQKNLQTASAETGETLESQYGKALDSISAKAENAAESWKRAFSELIPEDSLKDLYDYSSKIADLVGGMLKGLGGVPGILRLVSVYLSGKIVPSLITATKNLNTIMQNATPGGRVKSINNDYAKQENELNSRIQAAKTNGDAAEVENLSVQKNRLNLLRQVALKNEQINQSLKTATGEEKVKLQMEQQSLQNSLEMEESGIRQQTELSHRLETEKNITSALYEQALAIKNQVEEEAQLAQLAVDAFKIQNPSVSSWAQTQPSGLTLEQLSTVQEYQQLLEKARNAAANLDAANKALEKTNWAQKQVKDFQALLLEINNTRRGVNDLGRSNLTTEQKSRTLFNNTRKYAIDMMNDIKKSGTMTTEVFNNWYKELQAVITDGDLDAILLKIQDIQKAARISSEELEKMTQDIMNGNQSRQQAAARVSAALNETPKVDTTQVVSSLTQITMAASMTIQQITHLWSILSDPDTSGTEKLMAVFGSLPMIIMSASQVMTGWTVLVSQASAASFAETQAVAAQNVAKKKNIQYTTQQALLTTILENEEYKAAFAEELLTAETSKLNIVMRMLGFTTKAAFIEFLAIAAIIGTIIGIFIAYKAALKASANEARKNADELQDNIEKFSTLSDEIENNTQKLRDNIKAWKDAKNAGEDAGNQYTEMVLSLNNLNNKLAETGGNVEYLNDLFRGGLVTGNFDNYFKEVDRLNSELIAKRIETLGNANKANLDATLKQLKSDGESTQKYISSNVGTGVMTGSNKEGTREEIVTYDANMSNILNQLKSFGVDINSGHASMPITLDWENPGKFMQQIKELRKVKSDLEKYLGEDASKNSTYKAIKSMLDASEEVYNTIVDNLDQIQESIISATETTRNKVAEMVEAGGFKQGYEAVQMLVDEVYQLGQTAGLSNEQMNELLQTIMNLNPALASWAMAADKADNIRQSIINNAGKTSSSSANEDRSFKYNTSDQYQEVINAAQNQLKLIEANNNVSSLTNSGTIDGLNAGLEKQLELLGENIEDYKKKTGQTVEGARTAARERVKQGVNELKVEITKLERQKEDLEKLQNDVIDYVNNLSKKDFDLLYRVNVENIGSLDDLERKLDALREVKANLIFKTNYEDVIAQSNKTQELLGDAVKEFRTQTLSYDTVEKILAQGEEYYRWVMKTKDGYVLTDEALKAWNQSVVDEENAIDHLLNDLTDFSKGFEELAYAAADASEIPEWLMDDRGAMSNISSLAANISELSISFYNGKISKDEFFDSLEKDLASIAVSTDNLNLEQFSELTPFFNQLSQSMWDFYDNLNSAYTKGEIAGDEFTRGLNDIKKAADRINNVKLDKAIHAINEAGYSFNTLNKNSDKTIQITKDMDPELRALAEDFNRIQKNANGLSEALKRSDIAEAWSSGMVDYYDQLIAAIQGENGEIEIDPNINVDLSFLDDMVANVRSKFEEMNIDISNELADTLWNASVELQKMGKIPAELQSVCYSAAVQMLQTGKDFDTVAKELGVSSQDLATVQQGVMAVMAQGVADETNKGLGEASEALDTMAGETDKFTLDIYTDEMGFSDTAKSKIKFGDFTLPVEVPAPYVKLRGKGNFENLFTGGGGHSGGNSGGGGGNLKPVTPFESIMPTPDPVQPAKPTDFSSNGDGTKYDKGKGGSKSNKEKEFKKQEENDLKREKERYVNINSTLNSLEKTIDKVAAAEEDAWGVTKLRNLRMMNRLLGEQNQLLSRKYKEAQNYYHSDIANLGADATFAQAGLSLDMVSYNSDGTIANRENLEEALWQQIVQPILNQENALKASYNAAGAGDEAAEKAIEAANKATTQAKKDFDEAVKLLDKVDDSANTMREVFKQLVENVRAAMNRLVEYIRQKLDIHIQVDERDLRRLDQLISRFGDLGVISGETFDLYAQSMGVQVQKMNDIMLAMREGDDLLQRVREIDVDDPNRYKEGFGADFVRYFGLDENSMAALDEYLKGNGQMPAEILDFLVENRDALEEGFEGYLDTALDQLGTIFTRIEQWLDDIYSDIDTRLDYNESVLDYYQNALDFKGTNYIQAEGREAQRALMDGRMSLAGAKVQENVSRRNNLKEIVGELETQVAESKVELEAAKNDWDSAKLVRKQAEEARRNAVKSGDKATIAAAQAAEKDALSIENAARLRYETAAASANAFQQQLNDYRKQYKESAAEIVRSQEEIMQAMKDNIEQEKELAKGQFAVVLNGLFSDIDDMRSMYDTIKAEKDYILDDYDKNYNIDKLQRSFDQDMEANSYSGEELAKLMQWQEKLNTYKEEGKQMTQDEVDLMAKQLEILQAKAQLEDEMNNKNTMRLQRDASGNYSYVYSSDTSADKDDQIQKIKDLEYEYKKMLEGVQDKAADTMMSVAEQVIEFADSVNWQLYESSELYRRSVDVKMNSLINLLDLSSQEATQVFDQLNAGVGIWDANWAEHAGGILTQTDNVQDAFKNIRDALVGESGYQPGSEDTSTYFGAIMAGQHYWATEATKELKNATADLADKDQGIPHDFHLVTEAIQGEINTICGPNGSLYQTLHLESQSLEENIRKVLLDGYGEDNVQHDWNELELAIQQAIGVIVNTDLANLKTEMHDLRDDTGTTLGEIVSQFQTWRTQTNTEIQAVIDKLKEYLGLVDQYQNQNNDETYNQPTATQVVKTDVPTTTETHTNVTTSIPGGGTFTGGNTSGGGSFNGYSFKTDKNNIRHYYDGYGNEVGTLNRNNGQYSGQGRMYQDLINLGVETKNGVYWTTYPNSSATKASYERLQQAGFIDKDGKIIGAATGGIFKEPSITSIAEKGPELVLNKEDTENILKAVSLMRQTVAVQFGSINGSLAGAASAIAGQAIPTAIAPSTPADQQVHIEASFPGVSVAQEIEDALNSLITQAAQYNVK